MSGHFLYGKKILFIGIGFYDYDELIINKLKEFGSDVRYFSDQPKYMKFGIVQRVGKLLDIDFNKIRNNYQKKKLNFFKDSTFDYIFVLKGDHLKTSFVKLMRDKHKISKFIMYQWDSLNRVPNALKLMPYFDSVFSFDRNDCKEYTQLKFRPLFFREIDKKNTPLLQYDLVFIGWLHADRLELSIKIEKICHDYGLKTYFYLFTGISTYIISLMKGIASNMSFKSLSYSKVDSYISSSRVALDLPHPFQSGLTMRAIESIGQNKKLITTSVDIVNYDFYNPQNIFLIDRDNLKIDKAFFEAPYIDIPLNIYTKYRIDNWIDDVFLG
jgi:hypothetical protein